jgi:hypothetical protein
MRSLLLALVLAACGTSTSGMSGPTLSGKLQDSSDEAPAIQSNDILARDPVTKSSVVKHILIGWRDLASQYPAGLDKRAQARSRTEADALASQLLARVRGGENLEALMAEFSEDVGSAKTGRSYTVTPDEKLVFEFKRLSLRLNVGEAGLVQTSYGWHIVKRLE